MSAVTRVEYGIRRYTYTPDRWPDEDDEVIVSGVWYAAVDLDDPRRERLREAAEAAGVTLLTRTRSTTETISEEEIVLAKLPTTPGSVVELCGTRFALDVIADAIPWRAMSGPRHEAWVSERELVGARVLFDAGADS